MMTRKTYYVIRNGVNPIDVMFLPMVIGYDTVHDNSLVKFYQSFLIESGQSLIKELVLLAVVATLVCLYSSLSGVGGYVNWKGIRWPPLLKASPPLHDNNE
jgi:hypothetical protein